MPEFIVECVKVLGLIIVVVGVVVTVVDVLLWTIQTGCRLIKWMLWTVFSLLCALPRGVVCAAEFAGRQPYDEWFDGVRRMGAKAKDAIRTSNMEGQA